MKSKTVVLVALLAVATFRGSAQETTKPKDDRTPAVTPLLVQVVLSEFDGEKKVSSLPYTLSVNADERRARPGSQIRTGVRVPISAKKEDFVYLDIGTNIDCSATLQDDGRYKLQMTIDRSSLSPDTPAGGNPPVIRQFRVDVNPVLQDGESAESIVSTDPLNGHIYRVKVTLNVAKVIGKK